MKRFKAFSSVELGLTILLIIIIMSCIVYFMSPTKEIVGKRNTKRTEDVQKIINAISTYASENGGALPIGIPVSENCKSSENEMCKSNAAACEGLVTLEKFTNYTNYIDSMPVDPTNDSADGTGYNIVQNDSGRITVCAPRAEMGADISMSK